MGTYGHHFDDEYAINERAYLMAIERQPPTWGCGAYTYGTWQMHTGVAALAPVLQASPA